MSGLSVPPSLLPYLIGEKTDYSSLQGSVVKVNIVFILLIVSAAGLRFFVRFRMLRAAGLDDVFMIIAVIFALLLSTSCLIGARFGLGKHIWNLSPHLAELPKDVGRITKSLYGCYLAYSSAITFTKFSIMATYIRIFPKGILRTAVYCTAVVVIAFWISSIFAIIFTCVPVQAAWDYTISNSRCFPIVKYFYAAAAFNIATDLVLCFLPMPTLWHLKMPKTQRVVVCLLFSMGTFACVASILRLTQLHSLSGIDITYLTVTSLNWSVIEVGTAIVCASLSALRPLATRWLPTFFSHFSSGETGEASITNFKNSALVSSKSSSIPQRSLSFSEILVERTFDVSELKELPARPIIPGKTKSKGPAGMYTRTVDLFERSSEEELVVQRS